MTDPRCQVCSARLPRPTPWVLSGPDMPDGLAENEEFSTSPPPTCAGCAALAWSACPNLRRAGRWAIEVGGVEVSGVNGQVIHPVVGFGPAEFLMLDDPRVAFMVVRQIMVTLTDWRWLVRDGVASPARIGRS